MKLLFILSLLISFSQALWCLNTSVTTTASTDAINQIDISPDDRYFLVARHSGVLQQWDRNSYSAVRTYTLNTSGDVFNGKYSRDGKYIAVAGFQSNVDILNATTFGLIIAINTGMLAVSGVDFSYDSQQLLLAGFNYTVLVYGVPNWTVIHNITTSTHNFFTAAFSPDGKFVVAGQYSLIAFDALGNLTYTNNSGYWLRVKSRPDSHYFLATNMNNYFIQAGWDGSTTEFPQSSLVYSCDYSSDAQFLVVGTSSANTLIYNASSHNNTLLQNLTRTSPETMVGSKFTHDDHYIISGDHNTGKIYEYFNFPQNFYQNCSQICGDLITWFYYCDNQLHIPYDGCDDNCHIMSNFVCNITNLTTICSYNGYFTMQNVKLKSNLLTQNYILQFQLQPYLYAIKLSTLEQITSMLGFTDPLLTILNFQFNYSSNVYTLIVKPLANMYEQNITMQYYPLNNSRVQFWAGQNQTLTLKLANSKSFLFIYYTDTQKQISKIILYWSYILMVLGWICCVVGLLLRKLAGIQAMFVLQLSWMNIMCENTYFILPMQNLLPLKYTCFYNYLFNKQDPLMTGQAPFFYQFQMSSQYLSDNFNFSILTFGIPLIFFIISAIRLNKYEKQIKLNELCQKQSKCPIEKTQTSPLQSQKMTMEMWMTNKNKYQLQYQFSCQLFLSATMLNLCYFIYCAALFFKYRVAFNIPSIIVLVISLLIMSISLFRFHLDPCPFDYFRFSFKNAFFTINHWNFHILVIIVTPILIVALPNLPIVSIIPCILLLVYTLIVRPYILNIQNVRSAFNLFVMGCFISFRVYTQYVPFSKLNSIVPTYMFIILNLVALTLVIIFGLASSIYNWYHEKYIIPLIKAKKTKNDLKYDKVLHQLSIARVNQKMLDISQDNTFKQMLDSKNNIQKFSNAMKKQYEQQTQRLHSQFAGLNIFTQNNQQKRMHKQIIEQINLQKLDSKRNEVNKITGRIPQKSNFLNTDFQIYQKKTKHVQDSKLEQDQEQSQISDRTQDIAKRVVVEENMFINYKGVVEKVSKRKAKSIKKEYINQYNQID